jgi:hypothetical protein
MFSVGFNQGELDWDEAFHHGLSAMERFESLDDATARDELREGRHMSPDEAVAYALDRST